MSNGLSIASTALVANALGAGKNEEADRVAAQAMGLSIVLSLVLAVAGYLSSEWLLRAMGCTGEVLALGVRYMHILFLGAPAFALTQTLTAPLNARGNTKPFRNAIVAGCLLNAVFDPWFVRGGLGLPAMGFDGIAISTVLIQYLSVFYIASFARRGGVLNANQRGWFFPRWESVLAITRQGLPATLNMLNIAIGVFIINRFASAFGDTAIAAYGIAVRIEQIALLPTIGLNFATLALVGQNFGANRLDRVRETMSTALRYGVILCSVGGVFLWFAGRPLLRLFAEEGAAEVIGMGWAYVRLAAFSLFIYVSLFVTIYTLQGMKKPLFGLLVSVSRQIVAPLIFYPMFVHHLGLPGLWWGIVAVNGVAALLTVAYGRWYLARQERREALPEMEPAGLS